MKSSFRAGVLLGVLMTAVSVQSFAAYSESFKKSMSDVQSKILLQSQPYSAEEARKTWDLYDGEIITALAASRDEIALNQSLGMLSLSVVEKKGKEIEEIELGRAGITFSKADEAGKLWIVSLLNDLNGNSVGTFHVYRENGGKFAKVAAMEDVTNPSNPWNRDDIMASTVQVQLMGPGEKGSLKFASFHSMKPKAGKPNRVGIVWELRKGDVLKATQFVPEVDWHQEGGQVLPGPGLGVDIP